MKRLGALLALLALFACAPSAQNASNAAGFDEASIGAPGSDARAELYRPDGPGPFPAMIVLHGCSGVTQSTRAWSKRLASWGYVALLVDSLRPRGWTNVCNHGRDVPPLARAGDAFAAADYLRTQPYVRKDSIGIIGFSHGGWTVLKAVLADTVRDNRAPPFVAAVAYYPACDPPGAPLATDTLILIGDADDWTPATRCIRWRELADRTGHALEIKVYPGALHAFDSALPPRVFFGHMIGRDPRAAEDSIEMTRAFLAARLFP
jgi:dienelactone hydrolase